jgi:hypothetical protein
MARGSKAKYTGKQIRQAHHIEEGIRKRGGSTKRAARIAYATVNKQSGGGNLSGSGRRKKDTNVSARRGGKRAHLRAGRKAARSRKSA